MDAEDRLVGVITRRQLRALAESDAPATASLPSAAPQVAYPGMTLRELAESMANARLYSMPVVEPASGKLLGLVSLEDILQARTRSFERETRMERVRSFRLPRMRMRATQD